MHTNTGQQAKSRYHYERCSVKPVAGSLPKQLEVISVHFQGLQVVSCDLRPAVTNNYTQLGVG
jgi:hypothetical protein